MPTNKPASAEESAAAANAEPKTSEPFVERMFSGLLHATVPHAPLQPALEEPYRPLREVKAHAGVTYRLQNQTRELHVQASSPATDVMTDLSRVIAVTTTANATVDDAHLAMSHGSSWESSPPTTSSAKGRFRSRRIGVSATSTCSSAR
jgi:hypothetical protein